VANAMVRTQSVIASKPGSRLGMCRLGSVFSTFRFAAQLLVLAVGWLVPLTAPARVFERWGARSADPVRAIMVGNNAAYHTAMAINGGAGDLEVYACEGSPAQILEKLIPAYQAMGGQAFCVSGAKLGWGIVLLDGRAIRLLVANTGRHNTSTLFRLEQSEAELVRSQQTPVAPLPSDIPVYPGSRWTQTIHNDAANSTMATATVGAEPQSVMRYYAEEMPRAGWQAGLGPRDTASGIYLRGRELFLVSANSTGNRGQTVVILLHKHLKP
jgi:hypothetical protein